MVPDQLNLGHLTFIPSDWLTIDENRQELRVFVHEQVKLSERYSYNVLQNGNNQLLRRLDIRINSLWTKMPMP